jgi:hypothetical protein
MAGATFPGSLKARDTVAMDTPAAAATSTARGPRRGFPSRPDIGRTP